MINRIKKEQLKARKGKDKFTTSVLTALISEITTIGKNNGNRETTEQESIGVIKKFKKNVVETMKVVSDEEKKKELEKEISIYDNFLPQMMTENETSTAIEAIIVEMENPNMGLVMKELKTNYGAQLDMALASKLVKQKL
jgi:hypothetical protein